MRAHPVLVLAALAALAPATGEAQAPARYTCYTEHILLDAWLADPRRSVSPEGYLMDSKRYHPLTAATGGILAYERFVDTGDSSWFHLMAEQVRYFRDTARVDTAFGGRGIGIPYDWPFGRLKATWYSGMTQGVALSLLLRWEHLTHDTAMPPLMRRIAYFMVQPEGDGGTRSVTREGDTWIEEYPLSGEHRHVLNGFMNAVIGLVEYGARFPDDTLVGPVRDSCLASLRRCFDHYDRVEWSAYDRSGSGLTAGYLQYQLLQLQQLVDLTGDTLLRDQLRLWTVYAADKPNKEKPAHFRRKGWQASVRLAPQDSLTLRPDLRANDPAKRRVTWAAGHPRPERMRGTAWKPGTHWTLGHVLPQRGTVQVIELARDTLPWPLTAEVLVRDTLQKRFRSLHPTVVRATADRINLLLPATHAREVVVRLSAMQAFEPDSARMLLRVGPTGAGLLPWTAFERLGPMALTPEHPYRVLVHPGHADAVTVFYRTGRDLKAIRSTPWRARYTVAPGNIVVTDKPFLELLVVHPFGTLEQAFHRTRLEPLDMPGK